MKKLLALCLAVLMLLPLTPARADITVVDDEGQTLTLSKPAERIISLYTAHTETLYYLGAEDRLIATYNGTIYPPEAAKLPQYSYTSDPEEIIAADPDLVIIRPFITKKAPDFVAALRRAGIQVVSLYAESLGRFDDYVHTMAALVGKSEEANALLQTFHAELDEISRKTSDFSPKTRVYFESTENELRTVTADSMPGRAIVAAGGVNVAADAQPISAGSSIASYGAERILDKAEEIDVYVSQRGAMNAGGNAHSISIRPGFSAIRAIQNGRILLINEKLISSPSFRHPKGVRELARYFYPEQMDDLTPWNEDKPATRRDFANILMRGAHLPMFVPSSSKYYKTTHRGHTYGWFEDVAWRDKDFDAVETCVQAGAIGYDGLLFHPDDPVTRDDLAKALFVLGDFKGNDKNTPIADLNLSQNDRIVQTLVDLGVFDLNEGRFEPAKAVSKSEIVAAVKFLRAE